MNITIIGKDNETATVLKSFIVLSGGAIKTAYVLSNFVHPAAAWRDTNPIGCFYSRNNQIILDGTYSLQISANRTISLLCVGTQIEHEVDTNLCTMEEVFEYIVKRNCSAIQTIAELQNRVSELSSDLEECKCKLAHAEAFFEIEKA